MCGQERWEGEGRGIQVYMCGEERWEEEGGGIIKVYVCGKRRWVEGGIQVKCVGKRGNRERDDGYRYML